MALMSLLAPLRPVCLAASRLIRSNILIQQWTYTTVYSGATTTQALTISLGVVSLPLLTYAPLRLTIFSSHYNILECRKAGNNGRKGQARRPMPLPVLLSGEQTDHFSGKSLYWTVA